MPIALSYAVQRAVRDALVYNGPLIAYLGATPRVYDRPPLPVTFPFFEIGDDQIIGEEVQGMDASEVIVTVHIWSRPSPASRAEVKALSGLVRAALDIDLPLLGHGCVTHAFTSALFRREADGATEHAILTFTYHTTPNA